MPTVRYTTANGEIIAEKRNGVRSTYVPDPLGSTVALLDNTQTITDTMSYWPYGEVQARTGTNPTPFLHVGTKGYRKDSDTNTYVRRRVIKPQQTRWLTEDPIGFGGNAYVYPNSPTVYIDSTGLVKSWPKLPGLGHASTSRHYTDCAYQGIAENCSGSTALVKGKSTGLFPIIFCIIQGEGKQRPGARTLINEDNAPKHPEVWGEYACGPFQIIDRYQGSACSKFGYGDWKNTVDACDNIKCGIALLCQCLNDKNNPTHELTNKVCTSLFNAIYNPKGSFAKCIAAHGKRRIF